MATEQELLTSRIIRRAVLPVIKVLIEDDPKMAKRFEGVDATVQFVAQDEAGPVGACLVFSDEGFKALPEVVENPDITFGFSSVAKMNDMFTGKPVIPKIKGLLKVGLLIKVFSVLLAMKIMMPDSKPKTQARMALKVKMSLYMVTTALSQLNKSGDPEMVKWTSKQPERIYQWSCEPEGIACYLRVKAGKSQAGRGYYRRRKPFVHMKFNGAENALPVITNSMDMIPAISKGYLEVVGSPEYGTQIGDFMLRLAAMVT
ncbi:MAG: hypothetical protein GWP08_08435 [Nitrospiraceae bacterium]|nr:hypothetical protein [Nitrospiraceae bacterium]